MATTTAENPADGQEVHTGPAQPSYASAARSTAAPTNLADSLWSNMTEEKREEMVKAVEEYYEVAKFVDGTSIHSKARVVFETGHSLPVLRTAARAFTTPDRDLPAKTIRLTVPATSVDGAGVKRNALVAQVQQQVAEHYGGDAFLPHIPGIDVSKHSSLGAIVSGVTGTRFAGTSPARNGRDLAYYVDVAFRNAGAFGDALHKPYVHDNHPVMFDYAVGASLRSVVEFRIDLRDLNTSDKDLIAAIKSAFEPADIALLAVAKVYHTKASKFGPIPLFQGGVLVYAQVKSVRQNQDGSYRTKLTEVLPGAINLCGTTLPFRHGFEGEYCPRCRFAGHSSEECPRYPCASCFQPGHVASTCTNPTGKKHNGARAVQNSAPSPTPVVGSQSWTDARPGNKAATSANTVPLGSNSRYAALPVEETQDSSINSNPQVNTSPGPTKSERRAASRERKNAAKAQNNAPVKPAVPAIVVDKADTTPVTPSARPARSAPSIADSDAHNDKRARPLTTPINIQVRGAANESHTSSLSDSSSSSALSSALAPAAQAGHEDVTMEGDVGFLGETQTELEEDSDDDDEDVAARLGLPSPSPATATPATATPAPSPSA
ncbi:hypothetical protein NBRC10512_004286 [Rhodotorula toruloides]|uniref:RHTO0S02e06216g1_1 n=2 Tax=Rhodotorula toruloides TaxID=5286 RepID=A0A061APT4_RHOTO|nr:zinc finger, CCHC-type domain containing protein [Rhodotorula toruloides NP11]EMS21883.1 zinc finger, CCHC-type domain containing protein [Rhodotorula toruloides NP11]CDR36737.1 RHTO0S02e06216g1_1 [Rhodotorula toruloides]